VISFAHSRRARSLEHALPRIVGFENYQADLQTGELRKNGTKIRLSGQPFQILALLLEKPGELITREGMRAKLWPDEVFVDFDHSLNAAVNKLREALCDSTNDVRFIETLPKRGYRFIGRIEVRDGPAGRPAVAISSEPNAPPPREGLNQPHTMRKYAVALIAILFAGLLTGLYVYARRGRPPSSSVVPPIQSVAVLPLVNLTGNPDQEYFADAMTEVLTTELGKLTTLRVISRTSAMRYKQTKKSVPEIARELNADAVVEGAIRRSGDRVAITAHLVYAPADRHLWAQSYEHDLRDVLSMQHEVAEQIAYEVQAKIVPHPSRPTARKVNPEAYEDYLLGRYAWETRSKESLFRALTYFQRAQDKDPSFALAYAGEAEAYIPLAASGLVPPREYLEKAKVAATKALALDDSLAEAHNALGAVFCNQYHWQDSEREYKRAIELNPNYATAHLWYGFLLEALGQQSANLAERKLAHELDPLNFTASGAVGDAYFYLGQYDQAIAEYKRALELNPDFSITRKNLGVAYEAKGMYPEAIAEYTKVGALPRLGRAYALSGNRPKAREILKKLDDESKTHYVSPVSQATVLAGLGENEEAISWLEKAERENATLHHLNVDPAFAPLRSNPRFQKLLQRIGFAR
jgi:TolB-like protein/DNA-binding winged helix-turn-helix (wHTH) protein/Tfp pilus assembly protein PilF